MKSFQGKHFNQGIFRISIESTFGIHVDTQEKNAWVGTTMETQRKHAAGPTSTLGLVCPPWHVPWLKRRRWRFGEYGNIIPYGSLHLDMCCKLQKPYNKQKHPFPRSARRVSECHPNAWLQDQRIILTMDDVLAWVKQVANGVDQTRSAWEKFSTDLYRIATN